VRCWAPRRWRRNRSLFPGGKRLLSLPRYRSRRTVRRNVLLTRWAFAYSNSGTRPPLTALADSAVGGNGIYNNSLYNNSLAFPTLTYEATNYFIDAFFTPAAGRTPVLSLSFDPPNPSIASTVPLESAALSRRTWKPDFPRRWLGC
jgi:hypothetical protein